MDKLATADELLSAVLEAKSVSFGGGGHSRKPMAAICAMARSEMAPVDVTVMLGGPDVDILIAYDKVRQLQFSFMGLGPLGLLPNFRRARENSSLAVVEASEHLIVAALEAAANGVPFMPTRSGLGTDILTRPNTPYRTMKCPLTGETLVAVPAARVDVAVLHVNVADRRGNCLIFGDPFVDELLARAARSVWVTAERVVEELPPIDARPAGRLISRVWTTGVVEAPGGAGFTGIYPDWPHDLEQAAQYQKHGTEIDWLDKFTARCSQVLGARRS